LHPFKVENVTSSLRKENWGYQLTFPTVKGKTYRLYPAN
jgi:hypothetical protein